MPALEEHWGTHIYIYSRIVFGATWSAGKNLVDWGLVNEKEYRSSFASRGIDECVRARTNRSARRPIVGYFSPSSYGKGNGNFTADIHPDLHPERHTPR